MDNAVRRPSYVPSPSSIVRCVCVVVVCPALRPSIVHPSLSSVPSSSVPSVPSVPCVRPVCPPPSYVLDKIMHGAGMKKKSKSVSKGRSSKEEGKGKATGKGAGKAERNRTIIESVEIGQL